MEKNQLILSVKDLNIKFNLRGKVLHAIRGIDLDIYHGEVLAIVGESGSGKSVFTKSFMGLLDANGSISSGTIDYFGADDGKPIRLSDLKKEKDWLRVRGHEIAMIMQDPMTSLNPLKTIGDQIMEAVELHQGLRGKAAKEKTLEYLRDVGIADPEVRFGQYPHEFSGGMRQRVVIAIAVACNPQILICDEPTTALDVTIQAQILQLLKEMQVKYNLTIVLITHDLGVVAQTCEKVMVMYAGEAIEYGTAEDIFETTQRHPYTQGLFNAIPKLDENTKRLEEASKELNFRLVNLSDITTHPSPNYLLVLQRSQQEAIAADAGLLIVESDVVVKKNTLQELYDGAAARSGCAIAAAVTVDENGVINYPYLHAKGNEGKVYAEKKHCSFCCSLLTPEFLRAFDFRQLDPTKNWFDVTISHEALKQGFQNYLFTTLPVWHRPHGSRPWKQLKYKNPLKYYWLKYTKGLDKI